MNENKRKRDAPAVSPYIKFIPDFALNKKSFSAFSKRFLII